jgi:ABC-type sugar transport system permease subunit
MNLFKDKDFSSGKLALFFSAPAIFVLCVTVLIPIIYAVYLSLHRYKLKRAKRPFIGFDNYEKILTSEKFWDSLSTSLVFAISSVAIIITVSFFLALLLDQDFPGICNDHPNHCTGHTTEPSHILVNDSSHGENSIDDSERWMK